MYFEKDDNNKSKKYETTYQNTRYLTEYYKNMKFQMSGLGKQQNLDPKHNCDTVSSYIKSIRKYPPILTKQKQAQKGVTQ